MPTGLTPGHRGSIAAPQDGRYQEKNVHGVRSGTVKKSVSIRSFSLTHDNARYLDGVNKGHKSEVVNRALNFYRHSPERLYLMENIAGLQERLREAHEKISELASALKISDDEAKKVPPSRGLTRFFNFRRA